MISKVKEKKIFLSLHDARVSEPIKTINAIKLLQKRYNVKFAVYLVFDDDLNKESDLYKFLKEKVDNNSLEVVFHGNSHSCPVGTAKYLSFYHKYEAEYLYDSKDLREKATNSFMNFKTLFSGDSGFCPPCWLLTKENYKLFKSLNPYFIERLLSIEHNKSKYFSPIISIGTSKKSEIFFLKRIANLMLNLGVLTNNAKMRIAIHICDTEIENTLLFFEKKINKIKNYGYEFVLPKTLLKKE